MIIYNGEGTGPGISRLDTTSTGSAWEGSNDGGKSGPSFNIKMLSYQYKKYYSGEKTALRSSSLQWDFLYTGKMTSSYIESAQK